MVRGAKETNVTKKIKRRLSNITGSSAGETGQRTGDTLMAVHSFDKAKLEKMAVTFVDHYLNEDKIAAAKWLFENLPDRMFAEELAPYVEKEFNNRGYIFPEYQREEII